MEFFTLPEEIIREIFEKIGDYKTILCSTYRVCRSFLYIVKTLKLEEEYFSSVYETPALLLELLKMKSKRLSFSFMFTNTIINMNDEYVEGRSFFMYNGLTNKSTYLFIAEDETVYEGDNKSIRKAINMIDDEFELNGEGVNSLYLLRTERVSLRIPERKCIKVKCKVSLNGISTISILFSDMSGVSLTSEDASKYENKGFYFVPNDGNDILPFSITIRVDNDYITEVDLFEEDLILQSNGDYRKSTMIYTGEKRVTHAIFDITIF